MDLIIYLGGGAAALLAIGPVLRWVWRANRRLVQAADAAPRILALVQELSPNHGRSIKDTVDRTERKVDETMLGLAELTERFDQHLADHASGNQ